MLKEIVIFTTRPQRPHLLSSLTARPPHLKFLDPPFGGRLVAGSEIDLPILARDGKEHVQPPTLDRAAAVTDRRLAIAGHDEHRPQGDLRRSGEQTRARPDDRTVRRHAHRANRTLLAGTKGAHSKHPQ
jgi:hypothetical protein